ncbi:MAG: hypothetical protein ACI80V_002903 [Rhodothermales bacterium]|jgi:hypothetical protein
MLRKIVRVALLALVSVTLVSPANSQTRRPVPYPVIPDLDFQQALENGTRSTTGAPGANYWTNTADYVISATLSPTSRILRGAETVSYHNNSPHQLDSVAVHLRQNIHAEGAVRNRPQQVTGGVRQRGV